MRSTFLNKRLLLVFMALISLGTVEAQYPSYTRLSTDPLKERGLSKSYGLRLIGHAEESLYYLHVPQRERWRNNGDGYNPLYFISKLDTNLNIQIRRKVPLFHQRYLTTFAAAILFDGKLWVFSTFSNKKAKRHYLLVREINLQTLEPEGEMRVVGGLGFSDWKTRPLPNVTCQLSENNEKLLISFSLIDNSQLVLNNTLYVYQKGMTIDGYIEHLFKSENSNEVFDLHGAVVSDEGSVYHFGRLFPSLKISRQRAVITRQNRNVLESLLPPGSQFKYIIEKCSPDNYTGTVYTMELPEHFIRNMRMKILDDGEILCYGICSEKGKISASGGFVCRFNRHTGTISDLIIAPMDTRLSESFFSEAEINEYRKYVGYQEEWDPFEYTLSELKTRTDGTHYFMADQTLEGRRVETRSDAIFYTDTYYGNSLFVFSMDAAKDKMKADRIDKRQNMYPTNWHCGYIDIEHNGNLWFLFNHVPRIISFQKKVRLGEIRLVQLATDGTQKTVVLEKDVTCYTLCILPETVYRLSNGEMIYGIMNFVHSDIGFEKLTLH